MDSYSYKLCTKYLRPPVYVLQCFVIYCNYAAAVSWCFATRLDVMVFMSNSCVEHHSRSGAQQQQQQQQQQQVRNMVGNLNLEQGACEWIDSKFLLFRAAHIGFCHFCLIALFRPMCHQKDLSDSKLLWNHNEAMLRVGPCMETVTWAEAPPKLDAKFEDHALYQIKSSVLKACLLSLTSRHDWICGICRLLEHWSWISV